MRWQIRVLLWTVAFVFGGFVLDQAVWTMRGSPTRQVEVRVLTTMELKNHKEDYGTADVEQVTCEPTLLPFPAEHGWSKPCWWLEQHREVIHRF